MFAIELMMPEVSVAHLPAGRARDRHRDLHRALIFFGHAARLRRADQLAGARNRPRTLDALLLYALLGAPDRASRRQRSSAACTSPRTAFEQIRKPYLRHCVGMLSIGVMIYAFFDQRLATTTSTASAIRPCRRSSLAVIRSAGAAGTAVRRKARGDLDQPRLRLVGRHFLAVALHGRDARRRLRRLWCNAGLPDARLRHSTTFAMVGMGGDGRRRHRRGHDRRHHDLRDDPRLRSSSCR